MYGLKDAPPLGAHSGAGFLAMGLLPTLGGNYKMPRLSRLGPAPPALTVPEPPAPAVAAVSAILLWRNVRGRRAVWDL